MKKTNEITNILNNLDPTDRISADRLLELVYDDLRRLASAYMKNERTDHTLQPTALVHEAYMRLVDWKNVSWESRAQFFSVAAEVMRHVLIDKARYYQAQKHKGHKLAIDEAISFSDQRPIDILALGEALESLEKVDPREAKIVELRFFGGLSIAETAYVLGISETTVRREWTFAKAWFQRELADR